MNELPIVVPVVGFVAAVLGACASVPDAVWHILEQVRATITRGFDRIRCWWSTRRGRIVSGTLSGTVPAVSASFGGVGLLTATSGITTTDINLRVSQLETEVKAIRQQVAEVSQRLAETVDQHQQSLNELRFELSERLNKLQSRLDEQQDAQTRVDSRALLPLVIALGLTTFPSWLTSTPMLGTVAVALGVGSSVASVLILVYSRPQS